MDIVDQLTLLEEQFTKLLPLLHQKANYTDVVPVGAIVYFANNTKGKPVIPKGYLYCDGTEVSRTVYAQLYEAIGDISGPGDGLTTFKLPDLRKYFIRGYDNREPTRLLGSTQGDAMRPLKGSFGTLDGTVTNGVFKQGTTDSRSYYARITTANKTSIELDSSSQVPTADEVRPINQAWLPCIKYTNFVGPDATFYSDTDDLYVRGRIYSIGSINAGATLPPNVEPTQGLILTSVISVAATVTRGSDVEFTDDKISGKIKALIGGEQIDISFAPIAISISGADKRMRFFLTQDPDCDVFTLVYNNQWIPLTKESSGTFVLQNQELIALFTTQIAVQSVQLQFRAFYKDAHNV